MYEISYFRKKNDHFSFAVTPDRTGSALPTPEAWEHWFSDFAYPEYGVGPVLRDYQNAFSQNGYYVFPRHGSMKPEVLSSP